MKILIILAIVVFVADIIVKTYLEKNKDSENSLNTDILPYNRKFLLTKNEYYFYKQLKEIAEKFNLCILAKVRLADLIEVNNDVKGKDKLKYFSKIKSKHIDFVLCEKDNLYPKLLIELQDSSHNLQDRKDRDEFIKKVCEKTNYQIIFVYNTTDLEKRVTEVLSPNNINNESEINKQ